MTRLARTKRRKSKLLRRKGSSAIANSDANMRLGEERGQRWKCAPGLPASRSRDHKKATMQQLTQRENANFGWLKQPCDILGAERLTCRCGSWQVNAALFQELVHTGSADGHAIALFSGRGEALHSDNTDHLPAIIQ